MKYLADYEFDCMKPTPVDKDSFGFEYCPIQIIDEYNSRWRCLEKISFEEFYQSIHSRGADMNGWFIDSNDVLQTYDSYIVGDTMRRYPKLPVHPNTVLKQVIKEFEDKYDGKE